MQLFGLINSLILREPETNRRNLTIQVNIAYAVGKLISPLSALLYHSLEPVKWADRLGPQLRHVAFPDTGL